jgi:hypothetical protein
MEVSQNKEEIEIKIVPVLKVINYLPIDVDIELNCGNKKSRKFLQKTKFGMENIFDTNDDI